jgi:hypothetical protein
VAGPGEAGGLRQVAIYDWPRQLVARRAATRSLCAVTVDASRSARARSAPGPVDDTAATTYINVCSRPITRRFGGPGIEAAVVQSVAIFSVGAHYFFWLKRTRQWITNPPPTGPAHVAKWIS